MESGARAENPPRVGSMRRSCAHDKPDERALGDPKAAPPHQARAAEERCWMRGLSLHRSGPSEPCAGGAAT